MTILFQTSRYYHRGKYAFWERNIGLYTFRHSSFPRVTNFEQIYIHIIYDSVISQRQAAKTSLAVLKTSSSPFVTEAAVLR